MYVYRLYSRQQLANLWHSVTLFHDLELLCKDCQEFSTSLYNWWFQLVRPIKWDGHLETESIAKPNNIFEESCIHCKYHKYMFQDAEPAIPVKPNSSESLKQIAKCFKKKHLGHGGIVRLNASCFFSLRKTLLSTSSPAHWFSNKNNQPNPSPHHQKPKPNPTTCTISSLNPTDLEEMRGNLGFIGRKMSPNLIGGDSSQHICLLSSRFDKNEGIDPKGTKVDSCVLWVHFNI